jgi:hypothetical protein
VDAVVTWTCAVMQCSLTTTVECEYAHTNKHMHALRCRQPYKCTRCSRAYSLSMIEHRLLAAVNALSISTCVQDTLCTRCRTVSAANMLAVCDACTGRLGGVVPEREWRARLAAMANIARCVSWLSYLAVFLHEFTPC